MIIHFVLSFLISIALRRPFLLLTLFLALLIVAVSDLGATTECLAQLSPGNPPCLRVSCGRSTVRELGLLGGDSKLERFLSCGSRLDECEDLVVLNKFIQKEETGAGLEG
jgi:hypothetical protein